MRKNKKIDEATANHNNSRLHAILLEINDRVEALRSAGWAFTSEGAPSREQMIRDLKNVRHLRRRLLDREGEEKLRRQISFENVRLLNETYHELSEAQLRVKFFREARKAKEKVEFSTTETEADTPPEPWNLYASSLSHSEFRGKEVRVVLRDELSPT